MKRILIVDDDISLLEILESTLQYSNYRVKTLSECYDIFSEIEGFEPDLVILDYILSGINGGEICHQIKSNTATACIPVIIITAYPRIIESLGAYRSDAMLPKPFNLSDLLYTVDTCISKQSAGMSR